jgi:hypothetical protein
MNKRTEVLVDLATDMPDQVLPVYTEDYLASGLCPSSRVRKRTTCFSN